MVMIHDYRLHVFDVIFHDGQRCRYFMKMCQIPIMISCQIYVLFDDVENDEFIDSMMFEKMTKSDQKWCLIEMINSMF